MLKSELFREHIFMQRPNHDMQPIGRALEGVVARSLRKASAGDGPLLAGPLACGSAVAARTRALDSMAAFCASKSPMPAGAKNFENLPRGMWHRSTNFARTMSLESSSSLLMSANRTASRLSPDLKSKG
jgi:hypothetical protein